MLLSSILGVLALVSATIAVVMLVILTINKIVNWFRERSAIKQEDKDNIAFTLQERLKTGEYKTVQGIFNTSTNDIVDAVSYESKDIDSELRNAHSENDLVLYE